MLSPIGQSPPKVIFLAFNLTQIKFKDYTKLSKKLTTGCKPNNLCKHLSVDVFLMPQLLIQESVIIH